MMVRRFLPAPVLAAFLVVLALAACSEAPRNPGVPKMAPPGERADFVLVEKSARRMTLLRDGAAIKTYQIGLGFAPEGHKVREGDGRTPEGRYTIDYRNPQSRFHLSLHINYPDAKDRARAKALGVSPGGEIFIHGYGTIVDWFAGVFGPGDWTAGCIAVTNRQMEEIWSLVPNGVPIEIRP